MVLYARYSLSFNFLVTRRLMTELGTAPGKNVRTDVSKSGEDTIAFAGVGVVVRVENAMVDAVRAAVRGAVIRASLGVIRSFLVSEAARALLVAVAVAVLVAEGMTTKALEEQIPIDKRRMLNAAEKDPVFISLFLFVLGKILKMWDEGS